MVRPQHCGRRGADLGDARSGKAVSGFPPIRRPPELTKLQLRILAFIRTYRLEQGRGPSFEEIAAAAGLSSKSQVARHVRALIGRKAVTYFPRRYRSIDVAHEHEIAADFPDHIFVQVCLLALRADKSRQAVVIELVTEALSARRSHAQHPALRAAG